MLHALINLGMDCKKSRRQSQGFWAGSKVGLRMELGAIMTGRFPCLSEEELWGLLPVNIRDVKEQAGLGRQLAGGWLACLILGSRSCSDSRFAPKTHPPSVPSQEGNGKSTHTGERSVPRGKTRTTTTGSSHPSNCQRAGTGCGEKGMLLH
jgi:hypothetical protein